MAKIITTVGVCSTRNKPIGWQFALGTGESQLGGSFALSGDSAVMSEQKPTGRLTIGPSFSRLGCKYCGNKFVYQCGECGRFVCYDGREKRNAMCPACNSVADVPAARGNDIPKTAGSGSLAVEEGRARKLEQGDVVSLDFKKGGRALTHLEVGLGWDPVTSGGSSDLDSSVVLTKTVYGSHDLVYFGAKEHPSGSVIHHGDNLTGKDSDRYGTTDDENISVYLDRVPSDFNKLIFILNIYACRPGQTLQDVENVYIRIFDPDSGNTLVEYRVEQSSLRYPSLVVGMAFRQGGKWNFKAIGEGSNVTTVHELAASVATRY